jgi:hypothetical protein
MAAAAISHISIWLYPQCHWCIPFIPYAEEPFMSILDVDDNTDITLDDTGPTAEGAAAVDRMGHM